MNVRRDFLSQSNRRNVLKLNSTTRRFGRQRNGDPRYRPNRYIDNKYSRELRDGFECGMYSSSQTLGWQPTCKCDNTEIEPQTIIDIFGGAGTTAIVARRLKRKCILIELNPEYCELIVKRLEYDVMTKQQRHESDSANAQPKPMPLFDEK